jgi:hypothetical protein
MESTSSAAAFPTSRLQAACSWAARKQMVMKQVLLLFQRVLQACILHAAGVQRREACHMVEHISMYLLVNQPLPHKPVM